MKKADRVAATTRSAVVPSLGVQLRMPPGGDVCSLALVAFALGGCSSSTPLVRKADVALIVDHVEDVDTQMPMISRILHLLVIDILAVGVAMFEVSRRQFVREWGHVQEEIEHEVKQREAGS